MVFKSLIYYIIISSLVLHYTRQTLNVNGPIVLFSIILSLTQGVLININLNIFYIFTTILSNSEVILF